MADAVWYVEVEGREEGPMTSADLRDLARAGRITPTSPVRKEGMTGTVPAGKVKGLFDAPAAAPVGGTDNTMFPPASVAGPAAAPAPAAEANPFAPDPRPAAAPASAAPAPSGDLDPIWFLTVRGKEMGPVSRAQLKDYVAQGLLTPDTPVRKTTMADSVPARRVRGLFDEVPATATGRGSRNDDVGGDDGNPYSSPRGNRPARRDDDGPQDNTLAMWAMILGIIGCLCGLAGIAGLILGIIALNKGQSKGMAITGIVLGSLSILGGVAWAVINASNGFR